MCLIYTCKKHMFTVRYEQCDMAPYRTVALHTFSMEQVQSCTINADYYKDINTVA